MKFLPLFNLFLLLLPYYGSSQFALPSPDMHNLGLANSSLLHQGAFAFYSNPASLNTNSLISCMQRAYASDLSVTQNALAIQLPYTWNPSFALQSFGNHLYRANSVSASAAIALNANFSIGTLLQLQALPLEVGNYHYQLGAKAGLIWHVSNVLGVGLVIQNPSLASQAMQFGMQYKPIKNFTITYASQVNHSFGHTKQLGFSYTIKEKVVATTGVRFHPFLSSAGFQFPYQKWQFQFSSQFAEQLGFSSAISLSYAWKK